MNRMILEMILGHALITASAGSALLQEPPPSQELQTTPSPSGMAYQATLTQEDAIHENFESTGDEHAAQQPARATAPTARIPSVLTAQDQLDGLDWRVSRQEATIDETLTRIQYVFAGLTLLFGGCVAYLWSRLAQVAEQCTLIEESTKTANATASDEAMAAPDPHGTATLNSHRDGAPPARPVARSEIPRVQFHSGVIDCLVTGINESRRRRGAVETGYALVGKIIGEGSSRVFVVSGLIDEGPNAARSAGHHKADRDHQQQELELLQLIDGKAMHLGDAHLHPGSLDTCSEGDYRTDLANVRASRSQEMVFVIVTVASAHGSDRPLNSLCRDGLRLNFFYLGKSSDYRYRRFHPEVVQGPALSVPSELRRFTAANPVQTKLDFDNLRRLTAYRMSVAVLPVDGQCTRPCIEMTHKTREFKTLITFSGDRRQRPEVFVDTGSQVMRFQPAYLNGGWLPGLVWFTPIVLDVEREMAGRPGVVPSGSIETSSGERSAPAEAKASGPKGD